MNKKYLLGKLKNDDIYCFLNDTGEFYVRKIFNENPLACKTINKKIENLMLYGRNLDSDFSNFSLVTKSIYYLLEKSGLI